MKKVPIICTECGESLFSIALNMVNASVIFTCSGCGTEKEQKVGAE